MTVPADQLASAIATIADALFLACVLSGFLAAYLGRVAGDATAFLLSKSATWRAWRRKRNRLERMEFAAYLRERGELRP